MSQPLLLLLSLARMAFSSKRALLAVDMTDLYYGLPDDFPNGIYYQRNTSLEVATRLMRNYSVKFDMILDVHEDMVCAPPAQSTECAVSWSARQARNMSRDSLPALLPSLNYSHVSFIPKQQYSGFFASTLDVTLRMSGIDDLYIMGYSFEWCVFFTVLDAWYRGYNVYVVVDGSGANGEETFNKGLDMYKTYFKADRISDASRGWVRLINSTDIDMAASSHVIV